MVYRKFLLGFLGKQCELFNISGNPGYEVAFWEDSEKTYVFSEVQDDYIVLSDRRGSRHAIPFCLLAIRHYKIEPNFKDNPEL